MGFVDLPGEATRTVWQRSGCFSLSVLPGSEGFPLPPGFTPTSHLIIWAKVGKFGDLVFAALQGADVGFAGWACPRLREEVGDRAVTGRFPVRFAAPRCAHLTSR